MRKSFYLSLTQIRQWSHHKIDILVLQFLNNMEVSLLRRGHTRMTKPSCDACNGDAGKKQKWCMCMAQAMNCYNRDVHPGAVPLQNTIDCWVIHTFSLNKNGLICGKALYQFWELYDSLPVDLDLADRRTILCWKKASAAFIIPCFIDRQCLVGEVKIFWR